MKHLKLYNNLNESCIPYTSLIVSTDPNFNPEDLVDALEIDDIKVDYVISQHYETLIDDKGIATDKRFIYTNEKLFLKHEATFIIKIYESAPSATRDGGIFKQPITSSEFNSFLDKAKSIHSKVENICKRIASLRNLDIKIKVNVLPKNNIEYVVLFYELIVIEKDKVDIEKVYQKYRKNTINDCLKKLKDYYQKYGIEDPKLDLSPDDVSDEVMVALLVKDEIIVVAYIDIESGQLVIDKEAFEISIKEFNI